MSVGDFNLLREHLVNGASAIEIAERYSLNPDGVRGRLWRARRDPKIIANVMQVLSETSVDPSPGAVLQREIITRANTRFEFRKERLKALPSNRLMWIGDVHIPYQRQDALDLAYQIVEYTKPNFITGLNDFFDFRQYGRWQNPINARAQFWEADIENPLRVSALHTNTLQTLVPDATILGVMGNHDGRVFDFLRQTEDGFSEHKVGHFVQRLTEQGVLIFETRPRKENVLQLSPGLKIVHGISAAGADNTVGKATIDALRGEDGSEHAGIMYNTAAGHLHRDFEVQYAGVTHYNFGCLCSNDPEYTARRENWHLGVGIIDYDPNGRSVHGTRIRFTEQRNQLVAYFEGKKFDTELKK